MVMMSSEKRNNGNEMGECSMQCHRALRSLRGVWAFRLRFTNGTNCEFTDNGFPARRNRGCVMSVTTKHLSPFLLWPPGHPLSCRWPSIPLSLCVFFRSFLLLYLYILFPIPATRGRIFLHLLSHVGRTFLN